jgi:hypothetical protein
LSGSTHSNLVETYIIDKKIAKEIEGPDTDDYLLSKTVSEKYL